jgi:serine/threonine protein kinase
VYEIGQPLAEWVYRAGDTRLNRPVAIKFLSADIADPSAHRRFQREAETASSLQSRTLPCGFVDEHPQELAVGCVGRSGRILVSALT